MIDSRGTTTITVDITVTTTETQLSSTTTSYYMFVTTSYTTQTTGTLACNPENFYAGQYAAGGVLGLGLEAFAAGIAGAEIVGYLVEGNFELVHIQYILNYENNPCSG